MLNRSVGGIRGYPGPSRLLFQHRLPQVLQCQEAIAILVQGFKNIPRAARDEELYIGALHVQALSSIRFRDWGWLEGGNSAPRFRASMTYCT